MVFEIWLENNYINSINILFYSYSGTLDFLGINHYFSVYATKLQSTQNQPLKTLDSNFELSLIKEFPYSNPMWLKVSTWIIDVWFCFIFYEYLIRKLPRAYVICCVGLEIRTEILRLLLLKMAFQTKNEMKKRMHSLK